MIIEGKIIKIAGPVIVAEDDPQGIVLCRGPKYEKINRNTGYLGRK